MNIEYRDECVECIDIWGSRCHGHESQVSQVSQVSEQQELCNNCGQYVPMSEINFAGFCSACQ